MTQSFQTQSQYFNLTAEGIGFLNRPRLVEGKKVQAYYACTIQACRGDAGDKTRFDLRIVGAEAKELFRQLLEAFPELLSGNFKERPTVVVGFRAGDITPVQFETTDRKTGEKVSSLSIDGRLLKFRFIKVNKQLWYKEESTADTVDQTAQAA